MGKKTPLYQCHVAAHAKMVPFVGWDMPLHYGSQIQEHHWVRQSAGIFDVSHMTIVDLEGDNSSSFLRHLLANDIARIGQGQALYTCMLNEQGGILDDLIVYKIADDFYRLILNSATHDKDLAWLNKHAQHFQVAVIERQDLAMLAIQGPDVRNKIPLLFNPEETRSLLSLKKFHAVTLNQKWFAARTGYTGEDGFEIILPHEEASAFWEKLIAAGIHPCGLGARDTLRLEAGLNLYGTDMDATVTPLESNLAWTIAWEPHERDFIGRAVLEKQQKTGIKHHLAGLILLGPGVLRRQQKVILENGETGKITSGSFSPTLNKGIALARVPVTVGTQCLVDIRGKHVPAQIMRPPFVQQNSKTTTIKEQEK
jgi:aminomethyltransferase